MSYELSDDVIAVQRGPEPGGAGGAYRAFAATLPRLRYDQLMSFGWKILLPLATLNALVTAIVLVV